MISIDLEQKQHWDDIRRVTVDAFQSSTWGHHGEADLIDAIRESQCRHLSLVAISQGRLLGHILFSAATICGESETLEGLAIGPMSVATDFQRQGVGTRLITTGLKQVDELGIPFVAVAGHPDFYPRFGFEPLSNFAVIHGFQGMPDSVFFLRPEHPTVIDRVRGGRLHYPAAFGEQFADQERES